jgi:ADP-heptose:LPS heptosyltransferase
MELFSLIKHAKWIITNDTSASHISVITKTPSICILGGAHYGRFQPYIVEKQTADDQIPKIANFFMDCYNCNLNCKFIKNNKNKVWPCIEKIEVSLINKLVNEISF